MAKWDVPMYQLGDTGVMKMVKEFARVMGQEPNPSLSAKLITEEYDEWLEEVVYPTSDEAQLKELADLLYVIYGYANVKGWDLDTAVARVHSNNIGRCIQPDGSIKRSPEGKILKNPDYEKVELGDLT